LNTGRGQSGINRAKTGRQTIGVSRRARPIVGYTTVILNVWVSIRADNVSSTGGQGQRAAAVKQGPRWGVRSIYAATEAQGFRDPPGSNDRTTPFPPSIFVVKKDTLQNKRRAFKGLLTAMMEASSGKGNKELSPVDPKNLRIAHPEVVESLRGRRHAELSYFTEGS
jgi:hypothetical protein